MSNVLRHGFSNVQPLDKKEKRIKSIRAENDSDKDKLRALNNEYNFAIFKHGGVPPSGTLDFVLHKGSAVAAKFVVVEHSADSAAVAKIVKDVWKLPTPSVILSITGAATTLKITKQLENDFVDGLEKAARSADAWIFTGGTDVGVMALTGRALVGGSSDRTPCIGVTSWRKVMHKDSISTKLDVNKAEDRAGKVTAGKEASKRRDSRRGTHFMPAVFRRSASHRERFVKYWKHEQNSEKSAALDPHHTHFILVNDETDRKDDVTDAEHPWGDEIAMREALENQVSDLGTHEVPVLTICLGGGEQTFKTLMATLVRKNPLLILKQSGGAARAIALLVEECKKKPDLKEKPTEPQLEEIIDKLAELSEDSHDTADDHHITKEEAAILKTKDLSKSGKSYAFELCKFVFDKESNIHIYPNPNRKDTFDQAILHAIMDAYSRKVEQDDEKHVLMYGREKQLLPLRGAERPHVVSRSEHPAYPPRVAVLDEQVNWDKPWPGYAPVDFTHPAVKKNSREDHPMKGEAGYSAAKGWADPPLAGAAEPPKFPRPLRQGELQQERCTWIATSKAASAGSTRSKEDVCGGKMSWAKSRNLLESRPLERAGIRFCVEGSQFQGTFELGAPMNPKGRTGMKGRGLLGKWGPNHAADPIVTRWNAEILDYEVVVVQRKDTKDWALPGGMVDFGEYAPETVKREFKEEACNAFATDLSPEERQAEEDRVDKLLTELFVGAECKVVYQGYVDDPRNTDNAWMETVAYHFHCNGEQANMLKLSGGDDAMSAQWLRMDAAQEQRYSKLYASHRAWTDLVKQRLAGHEKAGALALYHNDFATTVDSELRRWISSYPDYTPKEVAIESSVQGADVDPPEVDDKLYAKLLNERKSYETPITFDPDSHRPLNPRGRTGVTGRGKLWQYGANQAIDPIVTRLHPRSDKLQVVAMCRTEKGAVDGDIYWAIPGAIPRPGEDGTHVVRKVKDAFLKEAMLHVERDPDDPTAGLLSVHISELVTDLFDRPLEHVYKGYVDDPRNTDNAWMETTAHLYHCSRELGGQIELNTSREAKEKGRGLQSERSFTTKRSFTKSNRSFKNRKADHAMSWLTIHDTEPDASPASSMKITDDAGWEIDRDEFIGFAVHWQLLVKLLEVWRQRNRLGLLQTVVKWGQRDLVEEVLRDHRPQATPVLVQRSFQLALILAGQKRFDKTIIELLLNNGAKSADVSVACLFDEAQRDGVDAFHFMEECASKNIKEDREKKSGTKTSSTHAEQSRGGSRRMSGIIPTEALKSKGSAKSIPLKKVSPPESAGPVTPWRPEHIKLLDRYVPNFKRYAEKQKAVAANDLVYWAILCGSFDLAKELWKKCETPLRTAIIAQYTCSKVSFERQLLVNDLKELKSYFAEEAFGVLDFLHSDEEARKLLLSRDHETALLCARKDSLARLLAKLGREHKASTLDAAIYTLSLRNQLGNAVGNRQFLAHPRTQSCVEEMWKGRSEESGRVMLANFQRTLVLVFALPFALLGWHVLELKVNDLHPDIHERCQNQEDDKVKVGFLRAWADYFRIPLVKRANYIVADLLFLLLQVGVFFQALCGPVNTFYSYWLLFGWVAAKFFAELQQFLYNPAVYCRDQSNLADIIACTLALIALVLRYPREDGGSIFGERFHDASDLYDYFGKSSSSRTQPSGWFYVPTDRPLHLDPEEKECPWTVDLEILRLFAAISCLVSTLSLLEMFKLSHDTGVLIIIAKSIIKDLWAWLKPVFFFMLGFAFVFSLLTPNYRNADTLEDQSPPFTPFPSLSIDLSSSGPFFLTFWALMGHAEPADATGAPGASMFTTPFLWFYEMISLVMFVNLLIARFNEQYQKIIDNSDIVWKQERASMLQSCMQLQTPTPSPLNLLTLPWFVVRGLQLGIAALFGRCKKWKVVPDTDAEQADRPLRRQNSSVRRASVTKQPTELSRKKNHKQLSRTWMMTDDIYEATNYTAAKVVDVEAKARKEYLLHKEKEDQKKAERKLEVLEEKMEDMQRELASKQVRAQSITALRSVIVQKKLDEVLRMLKAADGATPAAAAPPDPTPAAAPAAPPPAQATPPKPAVLPPPPAAVAAPVSLQPLARLPIAPPLTPVRAAPAAPTPPLTLGAAPSTPAPVPPPANVVAPNGSMWAAAPAPVAESPPGVQAGVQMSGAWTAATSGGTAKHASWPSNPQYQLWPSVEGASYTFELRQPSPPEHGIGFWIMNADDATSRKTSLAKGEIVGKPKYKKAELVSLTLQLPPRPNGLPYIVVVSTFEPQQLATFTLSVASDEDPAAKLVPLDAATPAP